MTKEKINTGRTRNFTTIVYPDSAPKDWQEILSQAFVPAFISPLHDRDINPDGTPKKPHWHVSIMFDSVKTIDQAKEIFNKINGVGIEKINSLRGHSRYLCHLDNPEKAQYDQTMVRALCGADYSSIIGLITDKYKAISEMIDYCNKASIVSYSELLEYAKDERFDWFRVLCDNGTVVIKEYLKSKQWTIGNRKPKKSDDTVVVNISTGEIFPNDNN